MYVCMHVYVYIYIYIHLYIHVYPSTSLKPPAPRTADGFELTVSHFYAIPEFQCHAMLEC